MPDQAKNEEDNVTDKTNVDTQTTVDKVADSYESLLQAITKSDGSKKYSSVEVALQSISPAQKHIEEVERENAELKAELTKTGTAESILEKIVSATKTPTESPPPGDSGVDMEAVNQLVINALTNQSNVAKENNNRVMVAKRISDEYGDKAGDMYSTRLSESGVSEDGMRDLIAHSPQAALKLLGLEKVSDVKPASKQIQGSINPAALMGEQTDKPRAILNDYKLTHEDKLANWRAHRPS